LTGSGTPTAAGANNYTVTAGGGSCTFSVTATGGTTVTSWLYNACDALDPEWEIAQDEAKIVQTIGGYKSGATWIEADMTNARGFDYIHFIDMRPTPLNTTVDSTNGILHFWFYASDVSQLRISSPGKDPGQVELTSSGVSDVSEYAWRTDSLFASWHNGWNEVTLKFSDAEQTIAGYPPDPTHFNRFRIYYWLNSTVHPDLKFGIDEITVQKK